MADSVFLGGLELCHGWGVVLRDEDRIVAESPGTGGCEGDVPLAGSLGDDGIVLAGTAECEGAVKAGSPPGEGDPGEGIEEFRAVFGVAGAGTGVAGGKDPGGTVEGIDGKAAVIRENDGASSGLLKQCGCLEDRVLGKGRAGFIDLWHPAEFAGGLKVESGNRAEAEKLGDLVGIGGGDVDRGHGCGDWNRFENPFTARVFGIHPRAMSFFSFPLAFLQNLGPWEVILIFMIVLILFGAKRLPELFRSFGQSIKEFKKATQEIQDEVQTAVDQGMKDPPRKDLPTSSNPSTEAQPAPTESSEARKPDA